MSAGKCDGVCLCRQSCDNPEKVHAHTLSAVKLFIVINGIQNESLYFRTISACLNYVIYKYTHTDKI